MYVIVQDSTKKYCKRESFCALVCLLLVPTETTGRIWMKLDVEYVALNC